MSAFYLSYLILTVSLVIMAVVFLVLPVPKNETAGSFKASLRIFSFLYVSLSVYCLFKWTYPIDVLGVPFLFEATVQAHLWGIAYLNIVDSSLVSRPFVLKAFAQPLVLLLFSLLCLWFCGFTKVSAAGELFGLLSWGRPDLYLRIVWFVYYLSVPLYYYKLFFERESESRARAQGDSVVLRRLGFAKTGFMICSLVVLDTVLITLCHDLFWCSVFNLLILVLYVVIGLVVIKSASCYLYREREQASGTDDWQKWRRNIIDSELYTRQGITIVQMARELNTNRTTLSAFINQYEGGNFNSFVNGLRVTKAMQLITENPIMPMAEVCLMVGYTDQANFSRHFKQISGLSPVVWKQRNCG